MWQMLYKYWKKINKFVIQKKSKNISNKKYLYTLLFPNFHSQQYNKIINQRFIYKYKFDYINYFIKL